MDIAADDYEERASEEKWFPVYDAIEDKVGSAKRVNGGFDALAAYRGPLPVVSIWQDGDAVMVSERRIMADPLDSDMYDEHFEALGQIAANMPKGFEADFECKPGKQTKYIGDKYVVAKEEERESGQAGVEAYVFYDAIETLRIVSVDSGAKLDEAEILGGTGSVDAYAGDDYIEVDFPAWALDYMVNAELGSVSRQERDQIESWK